MSKFQGAVIKEQGITFAIVVVKPEATKSNLVADKTRASMQAYFPRMQIVLASQDSRGMFEYQGRKDLVEFLASKEASQIPWREYSVS